MTPLMSPGHLPLFWILDWTSYLNKNLLSSFICECVSSVDEEVTSKKFVDSVQGQLKLTVLKQDLISPHEILAALFVKKKKKKELGQNSSHKEKKKDFIAAYTSVYAHLVVSSLNYEQEAEI